jgi:hypothetical protein
MLRIIPSFQWLSCEYVERITVQQLHLITGTKLIWIIIKFTTHIFVKSFNTKFQINPFSSFRDGARRLAYIGRSIC